MPVATITRQQRDRISGRLYGRPVTFQIDSPNGTATDHDQLEAAFRSGHVAVGDQVTVASSGRTWRCDPVGWSLVLTDDVLYAWRVHSTGHVVLNGPDGSLITDHLPPCQYGEDPTCHEAATYDGKDVCLPCHDALVRFGRDRAETDHRAALRR